MLYIYKLYFAMAAVTQTWYKHLCCICTQ